MLTKLKALLNGVYTSEDPSHMHYQIIHELKMAFNH